MCMCLTMEWNKSGMPWKDIPSMWAENSPQVFNNLIFMSVIITNKKGNIVCGIHECIPSLVPIPALKRYNKYFVSLNFGLSI